MKRSAVGIADVADWHSLTAAFWRASRGKAARAAVAAFRTDLDRELASLRCAILDGTVRLGEMRAFRIHDPKPRLIHAPAFRERVLHHALMAHAGPVLDRALVYDTYACRVAKGALAAVHRCQQHLQRFPWYAKIDIRAYFASIDHGVLMAMLRRRFKDQHLLDLMVRAFAFGRIDAAMLQAGYSSALAITAHADAGSWRREQLRRHPLEQCLERV